MMGEGVLVRIRTDDDVGTMDRRRMVSRMHNQNGRMLSMFSVYQIWQLFSGSDEYRRSNSSIYPHDD